MSAAVGPWPEGGGVNVYVDGIRLVALPDDDALAILNVLAKHYEQPEPTDTEEPEADALRRFWKEAEAQAEKTVQSLEIVLAQNHGLEEQLGAERHHLSNALATIDRERQTVDLERRRELAAVQSLQNLGEAYNALQQAAQQPSRFLTGLDDGLCLNEHPDGITRCAQRRGHIEALGTMHQAGPATWTDPDGTPPL